MPPPARRPGPVAGDPQPRRPPVQPILLSLAFRSHHASDRVVSAVGCAAWVIAVWLTFAFAHGRFGPGIAALAALFLTIDLPLLQAALAGLGAPYLACAALLAVWAACPSGSMEGTDAPSPLRAAAAGLLSSVAMLADYRAIGLPLVLVAIVARGRRRTLRLACFVGGALLVLLPWMLRTAAWTGSPVFSVYAYESIAGTQDRPGDSVFRSPTPPSGGPAAILFENPQEVVRKFANGFLRLRDHLPRGVDPLVAILFFAALLETAGAKPWRRVVGVTCWTLLLAVLASWLLRPGMEVVAAWSPLLATIAAAQIAAWARRRLSPGTPVSSTDTWDLHLIRRLEGLGPWELRWRFVALYAAALLAVGAPLAIWILGPKTTPDATLGPHVQAMKHLVPAGATVVTDRPALMAWRGERRALWLPWRDKDWDRIESVCGPVDAAYVTPGLAAVPPGERAAWWVWLVSPRGVYRDLGPAGPTPNGGACRIRKGEPR